MSLLWTGLREKHPHTGVECFWSVLGVSGYLWSSRSFVGAPEESTVTLLLDAKNTSEDGSIPNGWLMVNS